MTDGSSSAAPSSRLSAASSAFRFALELAALAGWGVIGWRFGGSAVRVVLAVVFPVIAAMAWGTFRVPGDESASGAAPVPVRGVVRLVLEFDLLILPAVLLAVSGSPSLGVVLAVGVGVHYATTTSRIRWLVAH